jgi:hypothetical protein
MKKFLDYWAGHSGQPDEGKILYSRYEHALSDLNQSRKKTVQYLIPVNGAKGWHPGFDPDATEEIAALANEIEGKKAVLKSVSQDIEDFKAVVGYPSLAVLGAELAVIKRHLSDAVYKAKSASIIASGRNPRLSPAEVQDLDEVVLANAAFAEAREQFDPQIADLSDRLARGRAILTR